MTQQKRLNYWWGYYLSGFVSALMLVGAFWGIRWYFQPSQGEERLASLNNTHPNDKEQLIGKTKEDPTWPTPTPTLTPIPAAEVRLALTDAVVNMNFTTLSKYLESEVGVTIPAIECCGVIPADQALTQLGYLQNALPPWLFDDTNPKIAQIKRQLTGYDRVIMGISANNYAVVFGLSETNRVKKIRMTLEYGTLTF